MSSDARRDEELATQRRAEILQLPYFDTSTNEKPLYKDLLTVDELKQLRLIPLKKSGAGLVLGITNTTSQQTIQNMQNRFLDLQVGFALISDSGYRDYIKLYDPPKQVQYQDISLKQAGNQELVTSVSQMLEQVRADDMLAYLAQQAHRLNASDIHIETQKDHVRIRFRMDGVLHSIARLTPQKYRVLLSAIATAGNISTASEEAQQGHISQKIKMADGNMVDINLRLETAPTITGIDIVMRLFNMDQEMYTLDRLGLSPDERKIVDDIIAKPSGLVLVVGPTGSGKTTTLYSMLNSLNSDERKIITIEDPVEYQFAGVTQISVTTKTSQELSFAEKLRAVLRLDPDIVMVGEVRDLDTAKTALQAALTGHLVLSTFHASSAAAALTRLTDVIGQNPLFVSSIRLVMAQRLVRKLDDTTKIAVPADPAALEKIKQVIETLPPGTERPSLQQVKLYKPGSSPDNPYGYSGQLAIREQFVMTGPIRELLEKSAVGLSAQTIEEAAVKSGMRTMLQDGILKVLAGETTLEEIYRVIG